MGVFLSAIGCSYFVGDYTADGKTLLTPFALKGFDSLFREDILPQLLERNIAGEAQRNSLFLRNEQGWRLADGLLIDLPFIGKTPLAGQLPFDIGWLGAIRC